MKQAKKLTALFWITLCSLVISNVHPVLAQITNPAISNELGGDVTTAKNGYIFSLYFVRIWNSLSAIGAVLVLGYFIWGAFDWLTSFGEKGKLEAARNKMLHAVIGLIILVSLYTIIGVISELFFGDSFSILRPEFIMNL